MDYKETKRMLAVGRLTSGLKGAMIHSKLFPSSEVLTIKLSPSAKMSVYLSLGTTQKYPYCAMTNSSKQQSAGI